VDYAAFVFREAKEEGNEKGLFCCLAYGGNKFLRKIGAYDFKVESLVVPQLTIMK
jgi:uncharacterized membrane protein